MTAERNFLASCSRWRNGRAGSIDAERQAPAIETHSCGTRSSRGGRRYRARPCYAVVVDDDHLVASFRSRAIVLVDGDGTRDRSGSISDRRAQRCSVLVLRPHGAGHRSAAADQGALLLTNLRCLTSRISTTSSCFARFFGRRAYARLYAIVIAGLRGRHHQAKTILRRTW